MTKNNEKPAQGQTASKVEGTPKTETRIALVLDRSGSMQAIREPARDAFNEAISRVKDDARAAAEAGIATTTNQSRPLGCISVTCTK